MSKNQPEKRQKFMTVKRLSDIENGKVLPTFEEFFKLCILYGLGENVNLKEMYPTLYKAYKQDLDAAKMEKGKQNSVPSPWSWS